MSLDDDTLLGHIKFADNQQANITSSLSSIQQAVVLNEWFVISLGELLNYQYFVFQLIVFIISGPILSIV